MSTDFTGVTFAKQKVTPADDAIVRRAILPDGILTGCALSYSGSTLTMAAGQLMVCGRQIKHPSAQNWAVSDATSGYARLLLTIDLTRTASKETFDQVVDTIEYATSADGFSELEQADINSAGTKYQIAVCVVSLGTGGITGIVEEIEKSEASAGKLFAVIGVTYPAGSTCTCTNGSKTLTAKGTSGKAIFVIPSAGTWTVTAVSGSKSKSKEISITAEGQVETVELVYEFFIFKNGSGLMSGYSVAGSGGNVSNDSISWSGSSSDGGISMYIKPAVALNNYTKLCVDFECSYNWGSDYGMGFGVGTDAAASTMINNTNWTAKVTSTAQGAIARNTVQCDISALTDSEYIKIVGAYSAGKVYNIWLE